MGMSYKWVRYNGIRRYIRVDVIMYFLWIYSRSQEKVQSQCQIDQLKERLAKVNADFERVTRERLQGADDIDNLKRQLQEVRKEKDACERKNSREVKRIDNGSILFSNVFHKFHKSNFLCHRCQKTG